MRTLSLFFLLILLAFGCQNNAAESTEETADEVETVESATDQYTITPFDPSTPYPDAKLESVAYEEGTFTFGVADYELKAQTPDAGMKMCANSAQGQHIHLIVDNKPYLAKYDATFAEDVADGEHYMLAFLSRSYHESIKTDQAHLAKKMTVAHGSITEATDIEEPMLFYSRPKGTYVGEKNTNKVMLDFYPVNLTLGADYKVKADINGQEEIFDVWQPYYIEGLPMGENTITLTLVDGSGNAVDTPLNPVTRTFTLQADPTPAQ
ncbi:MAG: phosphopeptide-binding protein [Bacteroidota bacterium]